MQKGASRPLHKASKLLHQSYNTMTVNTFQEASQKVNTLNNRPDNDVLLRLYALFKQATEGDVKESRPGGFDFKGNAKWDAWKKLEGTGQEQAQAGYVALVNELLAND